MYSEIETSNELNMWAVRYQLIELALLNVPLTLLSVGIKVRQVSWVNLLTSSRAREA
jgi:hypothetical protein